MSWFISLILAGSIFTSSNNIPNYEYQNTRNSKTKAVKVKVSDETETFEKRYEFSPNGKIQVSNINGSIYVEAWDKPEIHLTAKKVASTKERLSELQIDIDKSQNNFRVKTEYRWNNNYNRSRKYNYGKLYVTFHLKVPRTAIIDSIETENGSVEISNMTKYTNISTVNGGVKALNLRGTAKLSTVNGSVYADFDDLNDSSSIALETVNGSVKLNIPSSTNATVKASTVNGSISNQFNLPIRKGKYVGRDLYGRIGNGIVKIRLSSVNGGLSIDNRDGGTTNPAVNLLKQKTSDDFDDSFERSLIANTDKGNIQIDKSMKAFQQALKIAKKQQQKAGRKQGRIERDKLRKIRREERENEGKSRRTGINQKRIEKEVENELELVEDEMVRATDAIYLTRRSPFAQEKTGSLKIVGIPNIEIDAEDCNVVVKGWNKPEVKYTISRITKTGNNTKDLRTKISSSKSKVEINVRNDSPAASSSKQMTNRVRLEVFVPKKSNLKVSSNLELRLDGVSGELELNGVDGEINVRDSYGRLKVDSVDGLVRIIGFKGELESTSVDGDVHLEGYFKKIKSNSNDGNVYLTLAGNSNAKIWTNNMGITDRYKLGSQVSMGDLKITKESKYLWKVGKGWSKYNFAFASGKLFLRPQTTLN